MNNYDTVVARKYLTEFLKLLTDRYDFDNFAKAEFYY